MELEPKPESLWWPCIHKHEDMTTLKVGSRGNTWDLPFREVFEVLQDGKVFQGAERTVCKGMESWWRDKFINHSRTEPMLTTCRRVLSHVYSTAVNESINWPWSVAMVHKVRTWEAIVLRLTFRPRMKPGETWVGYRKRTAQSLRLSWRKMGLLLPTEKIWTTMTWAVFEGGVPITRALRSILVWRATAWWRSRTSWSIACDPTNVTRWNGPARQQPRKEDVIHSLLASMRQAAEKKTKADETKRNQVEIQEEGKKLTLEIKGGSKSMVDWVNGHAKLKTRERTAATTQNLLREWWCRGVDQRQRTVDTTKKLICGLPKAWRVAKMNGWTLPMSYGLRSPASVDFGMAVAIMESAGPVL